MRDRIRALRPFQDFFRLESASGVFLLACAVVALIWANSPFAASYFSLWATPVTVAVGGIEIAKPLLLWINDGLMAVFFFVVGLEIKREVLVGELASPRKAALSVAAALGGMAVPALVYFAVNPSGLESEGWGIPMATDIAFALGVLALLGKRVPLVLKVFVTAVAIVDDLGAVLVIAAFYSSKLSLEMLGYAALFLIALVALNLGGVRRTWPYGLLGVALWVAFLKSGVHATIAGVLLAMTIPARRVIDAPSFLDRVRGLLDQFGADLQPGRSEPTADQRHAVHSIERTAGELETPLARLEHGLHPWVAFFIMPVFALSNAGVPLEKDLGMFASTVTLGIIAGLFFGKQIGIVSFAWLAVKAGVADLPAGVRWRQIWGVALLCGIGFTMSLFVASLAFGEGELLAKAKIGVLAGSLISGVAGALVLMRAPVGELEEGSDEA